MNDDHRIQRLKVYDTAFPAILLKNTRTQLEFEELAGMLVLLDQPECYMPRHDQTSFYINTL